MQDFLDLASVLANANEPVAPRSRALVKTRVRLSEEDLTELATAYQAGATLKELANLYQIQRQTVSKYLKRRGVSTRYRVLERPEERAEVLRLYINGLPMVDVALRFGVDPDSVRNVLIQAGVAVRDTKFVPEGLARQ
jgi:DNA-binding CsgD family transcriptional regulator